MKHFQIALLLFTFYLGRIPGYSSEPDSSGKARMKLLFTLPAAVSESSGLIFFRQQFWTFNDGGGSPVLFAIDTASGKVRRKITVSNASNTDWEELSQDSGFLYIGDFGNNFGNRKDLKIYRIRKADISDGTSDQAINAEIISFRYADQKNFNNNLYSTAFDCEAMVIWGDSIVLFTKNWKDETSSVYCVPKFPGDYSVNSSFVFQSHGLVTGAALNQDRSELAIVGYEEFIPFVWLINMKNSLDFRQRHKSRKSFMLMSGVQTEGICFGPGGYLFISCEHSLALQSIFRLDPALFGKK